MGRRGLILRNPRRIATDDGERICLDCLEWGPLATSHDGHHAHQLPGTVPSRWVVSLATHWDEIPVGTILLLVDFRETYFVDETGPNSSTERCFLFEALDGPVGGQAYLVRTSVPASDHGADPYPTYLTPLDTDGRLVAP